MHHIPASFLDELEKAAALHDLGKLYLLADEIKPQNWQADGLRAIMKKLAAEIRRMNNAPKHALIFSGHMIDGADRPLPRFPASKEGAASREMRIRLEELRDGADRPLQGFAGGASGGDILFHELCFDMGIPTIVFLALPPKMFIEDSVLPAGPPWVERFDELCQKVPVRVLTATKDLPEWMVDDSYSIWQRTNDWMMQSAFALSGDHCSLMALWDEKPGDGPGGTKQMVEEIEKLGQRVLIINPEKI